MDEVASRLARVGELTRNQIRFWNQFYAVVLETYRDMNGDGKQLMPQNDLNAPAPAPIQRGGGQSSNVFSGGVFALGPEEALVIETRAPVAPEYSGFHLSDLWGQSLDCGSHQSSLNGAQAELDADGALRFVVAHRDPGVANWLDTTGLPQGYLTARWTYPRLPEQLPAVRVSKVDFAAIRASLPAGARSVSVEERRARIAARQAHLQRRYRLY